MNAPRDISNTVLHTPRLTLRPFTKDDLSDFYEYAKVEGVGEAAGWQHHKSIHDSEKILDMFINSKKTFAHIFDGKVIGSLGIEKYDENDMPELESQKGRELGFVLSKDYWGKGLMPEAVNEIIRYLFDEVQLDFIMCGHFTENTRSKRVQEKCGFKFYKQNKFKTQTGEIKDNIVSILWRRDYII